MVEKITLELPDDITHRARTEAEQSGRTVEQIVIEWIKRGMALMLIEIAKTRELTNDEKKALLAASTLHPPFKEEPSVRREDWYDDDGR
jgi:hypothetical protein